MTDPSPGPGTGALTRLAAALSDRYTIERELGAGGMATVYLAHDLKHDRDVALKVLHPDLAATIGVDRFLSEIKVTANLQHPNILGLFDSGIADGQAYYVMPYVEGESLRDRLNRERQLPVADALRIATGVADALEYAHGHGVIHRDIKPENILLQSGQPVVADFGIALAVQQAGGQRLTQTGMSLGTPQYMSPEQAMGERTLDARTDIYALGVITYEMLAGEPPFSGPNTQAIVARVLTEKPRPLGQLRETVSPAVEAAVHQALQKLPADRFATAREFAEALRLGGTTSGPAAASTLRAPIAPASAVRWRRWLLPAAIAGIALLIGGYALGRRGGAAGGLPRQWRGELLGGPDVAIYPIVSHNGQMVAFQAFVDGQTQLAVLTPASGAWRVLTTNRSQGLVNAFSWSRDDSRIYYDRLLGGPNGVYSISPLGTDDRLVLANAGLPDVLPDGSLLVARLNIDRNGQMFHFWPESGRLDTLGAVAVNTSTEFFRSFPDGKEAAFFGRPTDQRSPRTHLYAIDLTTRKVRMLAPDSSFAVASISVTPDNQWAVISSPSGPLQRIIAVARDGSDRTVTLASLTSPTWMVDVGGDGSLYFDQYSMPRQLVHYTPGSGTTQVQPMPPTALGATPVLPLPDGRTLLAVASGSSSRVVTIAPGKDATPFLGTAERSGGPLALLGGDRVLLRAGDSVAIASIATGQLLRRVTGVNPVTLAGSPDGTTIYYTTGRTVWAMPSSGGPAHKIRDGDAVAPDPHGRYLVVEVDDTDRVRLFHVPLDGTTETEIPVHGDVRLAAGVYLTSNAVGPDGRIIVEVAPPSSWFWPVAILDPRSGTLQSLPPGPSYDMKGGWGPDGTVVYEIRAQQSVLWRFRPVTGAAAKP